MRADVDDLGRLVVDDQLVEQRHLAARLADVGAHHELGQEGPQSPVHGVEVEGADRPTVGTEELAQRAGEQRLSAARPRRGDDVDMGRAAHAGLGRAFRRTLIPDAIREQQLAKIPLGRAGQPADVAAVVAFLASDEAGYITGEVINVGGGYIL